MPKIKTHSGAKKRFKLTKNGKVKRGHAFRSHLLNGHGKTRKLKRAYRKASYAEIVKYGTYQRRYDDAQKKKKDPEAGEGILGQQIQAF